MQVTLCDYIMPWDFLSSTQKKGLSQRYQMGCECKVSWQSLVQHRLFGSCLDIVPLLFLLLHLPPLKFTVKCGRTRLKLPLFLGFTQQVQLWPPDLKPCVLFLTC